MTGDTEPTGGVMTNQGRLEQMDRGRSFASVIYVLVATVWCPLGPLLGGWTWPWAYGLCGATLALWALTERRYVVARRVVVRRLACRDRASLAADRSRMLRLCDARWSDTDFDGAA